MVLSDIFGGITFSGMYSGNQSVETMGSSRSTAIIADGVGPKPLLAALVALIRRGGAYDGTPCDGVPADIGSCTLTTRSGFDGDTDCGDLSTETGPGVPVASGPGFFTAAGTGALPPVGRTASALLRHAPMMRSALQNIPRGQVGREVRCQARRDDAARSPTLANRCTAEPYTADPLISTI